MEYLQASRLAFAVFLAALSVYLLASCRVVRERFADTPNYDAYYQVLQVYSDVLNRNPTTAELELYKAKLAAGTITQDQLRSTLVAGDEYQRMSKTQSNKSMGELPGDISDRQVSMQLQDM